MNTERERVPRIGNIECFLTIFISSVKPDVLNWIYYQKMQSKQYILRRWQYIDHRFRMKSERKWMIASKRNTTLSERPTYINNTSYINIGLRTSESKMCINYLVNVVMGDGRCNTEIRNTASNIEWCLSEIFSDMEISFKTLQRSQTFVISHLWYECWAICSK